MVIHYDNVGSFRIATNPRINPQTRHIAIHYYFTKRKKISKKKIRP